MSSSMENTTLFLELCRKFLPVQFKAAQDAANARDNTMVGWLSGLAGARNIEVSRVKQKLLATYAEKFAHIRWSPPVVFIPDMPPYPVESIQSGHIYLYLDEKYQLTYTVRAPWGDIVTETLQGFTHSGTVDRDFLAANHIHIHTALTNKGFILQEGTPAADVYVLQVLKGLIQQCRMEIKKVTDAAGLDLGIMGEDLSRLSTFIETFNEKFETARLLGVSFHETDPFTLFRKHAGVYLLDKAWKMEKKPDSWVSKAWEVYRKVGTEKENMLIQELAALKNSLYPLHQDDSVSRKDTVCKAIESILFRNSIICQKNGITLYVPLSAVFSLPLGFKFGTSALDPGPGEMEEVFERAYLELDRQRAREFLSQYIKLSKEGGAVSAQVSHNFFSSSSSGSPAYPGHSGGQHQPYPDSGYSGYSAPSRYPGQPAYPGHSGHSGYPDHARPPAYPAQSEPLRYEPQRPPTYPVYPGQPHHPSHMPPPSPYYAHTPPPAPAEPPAPVFMSPPPPAAAPSPAPIRMPLPPPPPPLTQAPAEVDNQESGHAIPMP